MKLYRTYFVYLFALLLSSVTAYAQDPIYFYDQGRVYESTKQIIDQLVQATDHKPTYEFHFVATDDANIVVTKGESTNLKIFITKGMLNTFSSESADALAYVIAYEMALVNQPTSFTEISSRVGKQYFSRPQLHQWDQSDKADHYATDLLIKAKYNPYEALNAVLILYQSRKPLTKDEKFTEGRIYTSHPTLAGNNVQQYIPALRQIIDQETKDREYEKHSHPIDFSKSHLAQVQIFKDAIDKLDNGNPEGAIRAMDITLSRLERGSYNLQLDISGSVKHLNEVILEKLPTLTTQHLEEISDFYESLYGENGSYFWLNKERVPMPSKQIADAEKETFKSNLDEYAQSIERDLLVSVQEHYSKYMYDHYRGLHFDMPWHENIIYLEANFFKKIPKPKHLADVMLEDFIQQIDPNGKSKKDYLRFVDLFTEGGLFARTPISNRDKKWMLSKAFQFQVTAEEIESRFPKRFFEKSSRDLDTKNDPFHSKARAIRDWTKVNVEHISNDRGTTFAATMRLMRIVDFIGTLLSDQANWFADYQKETIDNIAAIRGTHEALVEYHLMEGNRTLSINDQGHLVLATAIKHKITNYYNDPELNHDNKANTMQNYDTYLSATVGKSILWLKAHLPNWALAYLFDSSVLKTDKQIVTAVMLHNLDDPDHQIKSKADFLEHTKDYNFILDVPNDQVIDRAFEHLPVKTQEYADFIEEQMKKTNSNYQSISPYLSEVEKNKEKSEIWKQLLTQLGLDNKGYPDKDMRWLVDRAAFVHRYGVIGTRPKFKLLAGFRYLIKEHFPKVKDSKEFLATFEKAADVKIFGKEERAEQSYKGLGYIYIDDLVAKAGEISQEEVSEIREVLLYWEGENLKSEHPLNGVLLKKFAIILKDLELTREEAKSIAHSIVVNNKPHDQEHRTEELRSINHVIDQAFNSNERIVSADIKILNPNYKSDAIDDLISKVESEIQKNPYDWTSEFFYQREMSHNQNKQRVMRQFLRLLDLEMAKDEQTPKDKRIIDFILYVHNSEEDVGSFGKKKLVAALRRLLEQEYPEVTSTEEFREVFKTSSDSYKDGGVQIFGKDKSEKRNLVLRTGDAIAAWWNRRLQPSTRKNEKLVISDAPPKGVTSTYPPGWVNEKKEEVEPKTSESELKRKMIQFVVDARNGNEVGVREGLADHEITPECKEKALIQAINNEKANIIVILAHEKSLKEHFSKALDKMVEDYDTRTQSSKLKIIAALKEGVDQSEIKQMLRKHSLIHGSVRTILTSEPGINNSEISGLVHAEVQNTYGLKYIGDNTQVSKVEPTNLFNLLQVIQNPAQIIDPTVAENQAQDQILPGLATVKTALTETLFHDLNHINKKRAELFGKKLNHILYDLKVTKDELSISEISFINDYLKNSGLYYPTAKKGHVTWLHFAASEGYHPKIIQMLVNHGFNMNISDDSKQTALASWIDGYQKMAANHPERKEAFNKSLHALVNQHKIAITKRSFPGHLPFAEYIAQKIPDRKDRKYILNELDLRDLSYTNPLIDLVHKWIKTGQPLDLAEVKNLVESGIDVFDFYFDEHHKETGSSLLSKLLDVYEREYKPEEKLQELSDQMADIVIEAFKKNPTPEKHLQRLIELQKIRRLDLGYKKSAFATDGRETIKHVFTKSAAIYANYVKNVPDLLLEDEWILSRFIYKARQMTASQLEGCIDAILSIKSSELRNKVLNYYANDLERSLNTYNRTIVNQAIYVGVKNTYLRKLYQHGANFNIQIDHFIGHDDATGEVKDSYVNNNQIDVMVNFAFKNQDKENARQNLRFLINDIGLITHRVMKSEFLNQFTIALRELGFDKDEIKQLGGKILQKQFANKIEYLPTPEALNRKIDWAFANGKLMPREGKKTVLEIKLNLALAHQMLREESSDYKDAELNDFIRDNLKDPIKSEVWADILSKFGIPNEPVSEKTDPKIKKFFQWGLFVHEYGERGSEAKKNLVESFYKEMLSDFQSQIKDHKGLKEAFKKGTGDQYAIYIFGKDKFLPHIEEMYAKADKQDKWRKRARFFRSGFGLFNVEEPKPSEPIVKTLPSEAIINEFLNLASSSLKSKGAKRFNELLDYHKFDVKTVNDAFDHLIVSVKYLEHSKRPEMLTALMKKSGLKFDHAIMVSTLQNPENISPRMFNAAKVFLSDVTVKNIQIIIDTRQSANIKLTIEGMSESKIDAISRVIYDKDIHPEIRKTAGRISNDVFEMLNDRWLSLADARTVLEEDSKSYSDNELRIFAATNHEDPAKASTWEDLLAQLRIEAKPDFSEMKDPKVRKFYAWGLYVHEHGQPGSDTKRNLIQAFYKEFLIDFADQMRSQRVVRVVFEKAIREDVMIFGIKRTSVVRALINEWKSSYNQWVEASGLRNPFVHSEDNLQNKFLRAAITGDVKTMKKYQSRVNAETIKLALKLPLPDTWNDLNDKLGDKRFYLNHDSRNGWKEAGMNWELVVKTLRNDPRLDENDFREVLRSNHTSALSAESFKYLLNSAGLDQAFLSDLYEQKKMEKYSIYIYRLANNEFDKYIESKPYSADEIQQYLEEVSKSTLKQGSLNKLTRYLKIDAPTRATDPRIEMFHQYALYVHLHGNPKAEGEVTLEKRLLMQKFYHWMRNEFKKELKGYESGFRVAVDYASSKQVMLFGETLPIPNSDELHRVCIMGRDVDRFKEILKIYYGDQEKLGEVLEYLTNSFDSKNKKRQEMLISMLELSGITRETMDKVMLHRAQAEPEHLPAEIMEIVMPRLSDDVRKNVDFVMNITTADRATIELALTDPKIDPETIRAAMVEAINNDRYEAIEVLGKYPVVQEVLVSKLNEAVTLSQYEENSKKVAALLALVDATVTQAVIDNPSNKGMSGEMHEQLDRFIASQHKFAVKLDQASSIEFMQKWNAAIDLAREKSIEILNNRFDAFISKYNVTESDRKTLFDRFTNKEKVYIKSQTFQNFDKFFNGLKSFKVLTANHVLVYMKKKNIELDLEEIDTGTDKRIVNKISEDKEFKSLEEKLQAQLLSFSEVNDFVRENAANPNKNEVWNKLTALLNINELELNRDERVEKFYRFGANAHNQPNLPIQDLTGKVKSLSPEKVEALQDFKKWILVAFESELTGDKKQQFLDLYSQAMSKGVMIFGKRNNILDISKKYDFGIGFNDWVNEFALKPIIKKIIYALRPMTPDETKLEFIEAAINLDIPKLNKYKKIVDRDTYRKAFLLPVEGAWPFVFSDHDFLSTLEQLKPGAVHVDANWNISGSTGWGLASSGKWAQIFNALKYDDRILLDDVKLVLQSDNARYLPAETLQELVAYPGMDRKFLEELKLNKKDVKVTQFLESEYLDRIFADNKVIITLKNLPGNLGTSDIAHNMVATDLKETHMLQSRQGGAIALPMPEPTYGEKAYELVRRASENVNKRLSWLAKKLGIDQPTTVKGRKDDEQKSDKNKKNIDSINLTEQLVENASSREVSIDYLIKKINEKPFTSSQVNDFIDKALEKEGQAKVWNELLEVTTINKLWYGKDPRVNMFKQFALFTHFNGNPATPGQPISYTKVQLLQAFRTWIRQTFKEELAEKDHAERFETAFSKAISPEVRLFGIIEDLEAHNERNSRKNPVLVSMMDDVRRIIENGNGMIQAPNQMNRSILYADIIAPYKNPLILVRTKGEAAELEYKLNDFSEQVTIMTYNQFTIGLIEAGKLARHLGSTTDQFNEFSALELQSAKKAATARKNADFVILDKFNEITNAIELESAKQLRKHTLVYVNNAENSRNFEFFSKEQVLLITSERAEKAGLAPKDAIANFATDLTNERLIAQQNRAKEKKLKEKKIIEKKVEEIPVVKIEGKQTTNGLVEIPVLNIETAAPVVLVKQETIDEVKVPTEKAPEEEVLSRRALKNAHNDLFDTPKKIKAWLDSFNEGKETKDQIRSIGFNFRTWNQKAISAGGPSGERVRDIFILYDLPIDPLLFGKGPYVNKNNQKYNTPEKIKGWLENYNARNPNDQVLSLGKNGVTWDTKALLDNGPSGWHVGRVFKKQNLSASIELFGDQSRKNPNNDKYNTPKKIKEWLTEFNKGKSPENRLEVLGRNGKTWDAIAPQAGGPDSWWVKEIFSKYNLTIAPLLFDNGTYSNKNNQKYDTPEKIQAWLQEYNKSNRSDQLGSMGYHGQTWDKKALLEGGPSGWWVEKIFRKAGLTPSLALFGERAKHNPNNDNYNTPKKIKTWMDEFNQGKDPKDQIVSWGENGKAWDAKALAAGGPSGWWVKDVFYKYNLTLGPLLFGKGTYHNKNNKIYNTPEKIKAWMNSYNVKNTENQITVLGKYGKTWDKKALLEGGPSGWWVQNIFARAGLKPQENLFAKISAFDEKTNEIELALKEKSYSSAEVETYINEIKSNEQKLSAWNQLLESLKVPEFSSSISEKYLRFYQYALYVHQHEEVGTTEKFKLVAVFRAMLRDNFKNEITLNEEKFDANLKLANDREVFGKDSKKKPVVKISKEREEAVQRIEQEIHRHRLYNHSELADFIHENESNSKKSEVWERWLDFLSIDELNDNTKKVDEFFQRSLYLHEHGNPEKLGARITLEKVALLQNFIDWLNREFGKEIGNRKEEFMSLFRETFSKDVAIYGKVVRLDTETRQFKQEFPDIVKALEDYGQEVDRSTAEETLQAQKTGMFMEYMSVKDLVHAIDQYNMDHPQNLIRTMSDYKTAYEAAALVNPMIVNRILQTETVSSSDLFAMLDIHTPGYAEKIADHIGIKEPGVIEARLELEDFDRIIHKWNKDYQNEQVVDHNDLSKMNERYPNIEKRFTDACARRKITAPRYFVIRTLMLEHPEYHLNLSKAILWTNNEIALYDATENHMNVAGNPQLLYEWLKIRFAYRNQHNGFANPIISQGELSNVFAKVTESGNVINKDFLKDAVSINDLVDRIETEVKENPYSAAEIAQYVRETKNIPIKADIWNNLLHVLKIDHSTAHNYNSIIDVLNYTHNNIGAESGYQHALDQIDAKRWAFYQYALYVHKHEDVGTRAKFQLVAALRKILESEYPFIANTENFRNAFKAASDNKIFGEKGPRKVELTAEEIVKLVTPTTEKGISHKILQNLEKWNTLYPKRKLDSQRRWNKYKVLADLPDYEKAASILRSIKVDLEKDLGVLATFKAEVYSTHNIEIEDDLRNLILKHNLENPNEKIIVQDDYLKWSGRFSYPSAGTLKKRLGEIDWKYVTGRSNVRADKLRARPTEFVVSSSQDLRNLIVNHNFANPDKKITSTETYRQHAPTFGYMSYSALTKNIGVVDWDYVTGKTDHLLIIDSGRNQYTKITIRSEESLRTLVAEHNKHYLKDIIDGKESYETAAIKYKYPTIGTLEQFINGVDWEYIMGRSEESTEQRKNRTEHKNINTEDKLRAILLLHNKKNPDDKIKSQEKYIEVWEKYKLPSPHTLKSNLSSIVDWDYVIGKTKVSRGQLAAKKTIYWNIDSEDKLKELILSHNAKNPKDQIQSKDDYVRVYEAYKLPTPNSLDNNLGDIVDWDYVTGKTEVSKGAFAGKYTVHKNIDTEQKLRRVVLAHNRQNKKEQIKTKDDYEKLYEKYKLPTLKSIKTSMGEVLDWEYITGQRRTSRGAYTGKYTVHKSIHTLSNLRDLLSSHNENRKRDKITSKESYLKLYEKYKLPHPESLRINIGIIDWNYVTGKADESKLPVNKTRANRRNNSGNTYSTVIPFMGYFFPGQIGYRMIASIFSGMNALGERFSGWIETIPALDLSKHFRILNAAKTIKVEETKAANESSTALKAGDAVTASEPSSGEPQVSEDGSSSDPDEKKNQDRLIQDVYKIIHNGKEWTANDVKERINQYNTEIEAYNKEVFEYNQAVSRKYHKKYRKSLTAISDFNDLSFKLKMPSAKQIRELLKGSNLPRDWLISGQPVDYDVQKDAAEYEQKHEGKKPVIYRGKVWTAQILKESIAKYNSTASPDKKLDQIKYTDQFGSIIKLPERSLINTILENEGKTQEWLFAKVDDSYDLNKEIKKFAEKYPTKEIVVLRGIVWTAEILKERLSAYNATASEENRVVGWKNWDTWASTAGILHRGKARIVIDQDGMLDEVLFASPNKKYDLATEAQNYKESHDGREPVIFNERVWTASVLKKEFERFNRKNANKLNGRTWDSICTEAGFPIRVKRDIILAYDNKSPDWLFGKESGEYDLKWEIKKYKIRNGGAEPIVFDHVVWTIDHLKETLRSYNGEAKDKLKITNLGNTWDQFASRASLPDRKKVKVILAHANKKPGYLFDRVQSFEELKEVVMLHNAMFQDNPEKQLLKFDKSWDENKSFSKLNVPTIKTARSLLAKENKTIDDLFDRSSVNTQKSTGKPGTLYAVPLPISPSLFLKGGLLDRMATSVKTVAVSYMDAIANNIEMWRERFDRPDAITADRENPKAQKNKFRGTADVGVKQKSNERSSAETGTESPSENLGTDENGAFNDPEERKKQDQFVNEVKKIAEAPEQPKFDGEQGEKRKAPQTLEQKVEAFRTKNNGRSPVVLNGAVWTTSDLQQATASYNQTAPESEKITGFDKSWDNHGSKAALPKRAVAYRVLQSESKNLTDLFPEFKVAEQSEDKVSAAVENTDPAKPVVETESKAVAEVRITEKDAVESSKLPRKVKKELKKETAKETEAKIKSPKSQRSKRPSNEAKANELARRLADIQNRMAKLTAQDNGRIRQRSLSDAANFKTIIDYFRMNNWQMTDIDRDTLKSFIQNQKDLAAKGGKNAQVLMGIKMLSELVDALYSDATGKSFKEQMAAMKDMEKATPDWFTGLLSRGGKGGNGGNGNDNGQGGGRNSSPAGRFATTAVMESGKFMFALTMNTIIDAFTNPTVGLKEFIALGAGTPHHLLSLATFSAFAGGASAFSKAIADRVYGNSIEGIQMQLQQSVIRGSQAYRMASMTVGMRTYIRGQIGFIVASILNGFLFDDYKDPSFWDRQTRSIGSFMVASAMVKGSIYGTFKLVEALRWARTGTAMASVNPTSWLIQGLILTAELYLAPRIEAFYEKSEMQAKLEPAMSEPFHDYVAVLSGSKNNTTTCNQAVRQEVLQCLQNQILSGVQQNWQHLTQYELNKEYQKHLAEYVKWEKDDVASKLIASTENMCEEIEDATKLIRSPSLTASRKLYQTNQQIIALTPWRNIKDINERVRVLVPKNNSQQMSNEFNDYMYELSELNKDFVGDMVDMYKEFNSDMLEDTKVRQRYYAIDGVINQYKMQMNVCAGFPDEQMQACRDQAKLAYQNTLAAVVSGGKYEMTSTEERVLEAKKTSGHWWIPSLPTLGIYAPVAIKKPDITFSERADASEMLDLLFQMSQSILAVRTTDTTLGQTKQETVNLLMMMYQELVVDIWSHIYISSTNNPYVGQERINHVEMFQSFMPYGYDHENKTLDRQGYVDWMQGTGRKYMMVLPNKSKNDYQDDVFARVIVDQLLEKGIIQFNLGRSDDRMKKIYQGMQTYLLWALGHPTTDITSILFLADVMQPADLQKLDHAVAVYRSHGSKLISNYGCKRLEDYAVKNNTQMSVKDSIQACVYSKSVGIQIFYQPANATAQDVTTQSDLAISNWSRMYKTPSKLALVAPLGQVFIHKEVLDEILH